MAGRRHWIFFGFSLPIWCAITQHALWGILLLIDPSPSFVTSIHQFMWLPGRFLLAAMFLCVAGLAAGGLTFWRRHIIRSALAAFPQQMILVVSAYGALAAMWAGQFADGVPRPPTFLIADQEYAVLLALTHAAALILIRKAAPLWS